MNPNSLLDSFMVVLGGAILLGLLLLAGAGTASDALGQPLVLRTATSTQAIVVVESPTPTATATATTTGMLTPEGLPTETPRPTRTPAPTRTPDPAAATAEPSPAARGVPVASDHYWFARPISPEHVDEPATFYLYASTGEGSYPVHHGVEFVNEIGVPVLAVAPGRVVYAGSDAEIRMGPHEWDPARDGAFYGNVVVIEHDARYQDKAVYTLYGHLDSISTQEGTRVEPGDAIGQVGMSGIALGPHLHFEVRVGENDYNATRNPQLWFPPFEGHGTILGKVLDVEGNPVSEALITLQGLESGDVYRYGYSYAPGPINSDDEWGENFVLGDIPGGQWRIAAEVNGETIIQDITVDAGATSWVWLEAGGE